MHLTTNCHVLCFFKTLVPLVVILCKAIGNAGFSEGVVGMTLMSVKVFIRGGTSNNYIQPANLKAPLPNMPDMPILVPDHPDEEHWP